MRAMGRHIVLAVPAITAPAGGVDLSDNALTNQVTGLWYAWLIEHFFDDAHKFMAQYALEIEVATCDFEIGVADTGP